MTKRLGITSEVAKRPKLQPSSILPVIPGRVLPVQGVKYTFLFLANFTLSKTRLFQHGAKAGDEGTVHHIFEGVVIIAEAFIGAPVHALGLAPP